MVCDFTKDFVVDLRDVATDERHHTPSFQSPWRVDPEQVANDREQIDLADHAIDHFAA